MIKTIDDYSQDKNNNDIEIIPIKKYYEISNRIDNIFVLSKYDIKNSNSKFILISPNDEITKFDVNFSKVEDIPNISEHIEKKYICILKNDIEKNEKDIENIKLEIESKNKEIKK